MTNGTRTFVRLLTRTAAVGAIAVSGVAVVLQTSAGAAPKPPFATTTTVKTSSKTLVTGQAVTFTATVKSLHSVPTPGGTVVFTVTGAGSFVGTCDGGNTVALSGGTAQCAFGGGLLAASSPVNVSATYTDTSDANYTGSQGSYSQTVSPGETSTQLTSSSNPSVTGQSVTFNAAVSVQSPASGSLTGSVTFSGVTCDGQNPAPVSGGTASCVVSGGLQASGSPDHVTATYGSDPNFAGSTGKVTQVVSPDAATVVLSATPNNCNGNVCTAAAGSPVSFTGTVTSNAPGSGTPTGSLVFSVLPAGMTKAKQSLTCDGGNTIALSGTPGNDTATCAFAGGLPADVYYTVTATLSDPNYTGSSGSLLESTGRLGTNTTISKVGDQDAGETFPVTATVTGINGGSLSPTGQVEISVCGANSNGGNGCQGTPEPLQADGTATLMVDGGEFPGYYYAYAQYLGDQNFQQSTATRKQLHVGVSPTTTTVVSSENPSVDGDPVNLTATVTGSADSAGSTLLGPPSGTVTFTITDPSNNTYTCSGGNVITLDNGPLDEGVAQCFLPAGTLHDPNGPSGSTDYTVNVSYVGDSNYHSSQDNYTQVVVPAA
ncbi:MAG: Ig-like domain repeat protein [Acidimicrobiales bacterium]|nr:Ig-like domain repeat protein [Acidimicrobiales bacterium]